MNINKKKNPGHGISLGELINRLAIRIIWANKMKKLNNKDCFTVFINRYQGAALNELYRRNYHIDEVGFRRIFLDANDISKDLSNIEITENITIVYNMIEAQTLNLSIPSYLVNVFDSESEPDLSVEENPIRLNTFRPVSPMVHERIRQLEERSQPSSSSELLKLHTTTGFDGSLLDTNVPRGLRSVLTTNSVTIPPIPPRRLYNINNNGNIHNWNMDNTLSRPENLNGMTDNFRKVPKVDMYNRPLTINKQLINAGEQYIKHQAIKITENDQIKRAALDGSYENKQPINTPQYTELYREPVNQLLYKDANQQQRAESVNLIPFLPNDHISCSRALRFQTDANSHNFQPTTGHIEQVNLKNEYEKKCMRLKWNILARKPN